MGKKRKKWTGGFILGIFIILFIPPLIVNGLPSQQPGDLEELETKINKEVEEYFQSDFIALLLGDQSKVRDPLSITYEGVVPIKGKITYEVSDNRMRDLDQYEREWLYIDFIFYFDKEGGILDIKYEGESGDQTRFTKEEIDGWVRNQLLDIQDKYYDFTIEQQGIAIFYVDMAQTGIAFRNGECVGQFGMDIYKADKGHTFLQRATFSHRELYAEEIRGEYGDYNFDGDMDIRMVWRGHSMQDEDAIGYHYWIYDKATGMFEEDSTLPSLYKPIFLEKRKTVYEPDFEYGWADEVHSKLQYVNGALQLVSQLKVIIDAEGDVTAAIEDMAGGESMPKETWGKGYSSKEWMEEQINVYDCFYGMDVQGQLDKIRGSNAKKEKASYFINENSLGGIITYQNHSGRNME